MNLKEVKAVIEKEKRKEKNEILALSQACLDK